MKSLPKYCPCCSSHLLRHTRQGGLYWFCQKCWQEMPVLNYVIVSKPITQKKLDL